MNKQQNILKEMSGTDKSKQFAKIKSNRMLNIIKKYCKIENATLIDAGCGYGHNSFEFSKYVKKVIAIDTNPKAIATCNKQKKKTGNGNLKFITVNAETIPLQTETADIVISQQVLEHVQNQKKYMREIYRILKKKGVLYLSVPNKFYPIEPHFKIPFMSLMPKFIANFIARKKGANNFDINSPSFWTVKKMLMATGFDTIDYTIKFLNNPLKYHLDKDVGMRTTKISAMLKPINFILKYFSPNIVIIGIKRSD